MKQFEPPGAHCKLLMCSIQTLFHEILRIYIRDNTFMMTLYIAKNSISYGSTHQAYHLNHWLLSLYAFKYLHCSVTLLPRGWN